MRLRLSQDQELFVDTTRRFLADNADIATVRGLIDTVDGFDREWWRRAAELGWTTLLAPVDAGGGGVSDDPLADLLEISFQRGRVVAPGPFTPANVAVAALGDGGSNGVLLHAAIEGASIVTLAVDEPRRRWGVTDLATTVRRTGEQVVVDGAKILVESAGAADALLVLADAGDGPAIVVVPTDAPGVTIEARRSPELVRRFYDVRFEAVSVPAEAVLVLDRAAIERLLDIGVVLQLAETVGALDRVLEFTIEWAFDRYSFGRSLASYQELKHRFADMRLWLEASKATVIDAAVAVSSGANHIELVSSAVSYVNDHGPELVQDCVQMHGGMGVTWEHDIHLYLRRVTVNSLTYGTVADHRERLAALIIEGANA